MFTWVTDVVDGITSLVGVVTTAPFSYFIGLALLGGAIGLVKRVVKR